jgi:hypothetical protein
VGGDGGRGIGKGEEEGWLVGWLGRGWRVEGGERAGCGSVDIARALFWSRVIRLLLTCSVFRRLS